ncbi:MAG TPA: hypothetical protein PLA90_11410, partial [Candidatus Sumerlaeota bacterium]|nr:hypothetical protein [Candidatus Sumerlaeota bacterium]
VCQKESSVSSRRLSRVVIPANAGIQSPVNDEKEEESARYVPALGSRLRGNDGKEAKPEKNPFVASFG